MRGAKKRAPCERHPSGLSLQDWMLTRLKEARFRLTEPRLRLVRLLAQAFSHRPFTAHELTDAMNQSGRFDKVTVYRTLQTLHTIGLLQTTDFADGAVRYTVATPDGHHHHHIVCTACRGVEVLPGCRLTSSDPVLNRLKRMGYSAISHKLEYFGICPRCQPRTPSS